MIRLTLHVTPMGKPRMVKSDAWRKRKPVTDYWTFKDKLQVAAREADFSLPYSGVRILFTLPMPKSWSKKERAMTNGRPHQARPDIDNLLKAVLDALHEEDCAVWQVSAEKRWGEAGSIEFVVEALTQTEEAA